MKVKNESEVAQSCQTLSDPTGCSLPGSSAHGIFQARVLELGAIAFSLFKPSVCLLSFAVISQSWVSHWQILLILMTPFFLLSSYFFISRDLTFMPMTLFTGTASVSWCFLLWPVPESWNVSTYEHGPPLESVDLVTARNIPNNLFFVGNLFSLYFRGFPGDSVVKNPPAKQEMQVHSLGQEEKMTSDFSILAWRFP